MLFDASDLDEGATRDADICVIGAGAAGITLARELRSSGLKICVLESGGLQAEKPTQQLYEGSIGPGYLKSSSDYLTASRLRYFGGTTNHWQGWCHPLDPHDFATRSWVANSGWPITRVDLDPYYRRAAPICGIAAFEDAMSTVHVRDRPVVDGFAQAGLTHRLFHFSSPTRFGEIYRSDLVDAANIEVILHANVTHVAARSDGTSIEQVRVASLSGRHFSVRARCFVLAAGGIENPRILLNSDDVHRTGLGNQHDLVGRYFMEHSMRKRAMTVCLSRPPASFDFYNRGRVERLGHEAQAFFAFSPELQREHRLMNLAFSFKSMTDKISTKLGAALAHSAAALDRFALRSPAGANEPERRQLRFMNELSPNPDNRVVLTADRDALGLRKVQLRWKPMPQDRDSIERSMQLLGERLGMKMLGRIRVLDRKALGNSAHHVGTTRMHADPKRGVVDPDLRVHGLDNMYVAGSSVFCTGGFANPTLTIVALAVRLADHLDRVLSSGTGQN